MGRRLIETLTEALRAQGSRGLHRNKRAAGFYRRVGFAELPDPDVHIFVLDFTNSP